MKKVEIKDLQQLIKRMDNAADVITDKALKEILRDAAQPMIAQMKSGAPTPDISKSIDFIERNEQKYTSTVLIGPRYAYGYKGQLAHFFEYGTKNRFTKDGDNRGFMTAKPFIRPAFDAHKDEIATKLIDGVFKLVTNKINK